MPRSTANVVFVVLFLGVLLGSIALVTSGQFGVFTLSALPIIFFAELIAFAMVYASMYYDGHEDSEAH